MSGGNCGREVQFYSQFSALFFLTEPNTVQFSAAAFWSSPPRKTNFISLQRNLIEVNLGNEFDAPGDQLHYVMKRGRNYTSMEEDAATQVQGRIALTSFAPIGRIEALHL
jgi:hypothetical protein